MRRATGKVSGCDLGLNRILQGRLKSLSPQQKGWLRRRQAVEPAIGHLKSDHRMDRCWLQGTLGDALHAISCAAGYNLRWLLRAIARLGIEPVFLRLARAALSRACAIRRFTARSRAAIGRLLAGTMAAPTLASGVVLCR